MGSASSFSGNGFTINMPEEWQDKTIYTLAGPVEDDIQHNILIRVEQDMEMDSVAEYADSQIESLEAQLQGCRVLKRDEVRLANGLEAYDVIFRWDPMEDVQYYQRQIYVLFEDTAYTLTTTFTKKSRKISGPEIDRILMSFEPEQF
jgi:hypothetical protein